MKLKEGIIVTKVGTDNIVVAAGEAGKSFKGMLKLNGTAAFIVEQLKADLSVDAVVAAVLEKYDVSEDGAQASVKQVVDQLTQIGLVE